MFGSFGGKKSAPATPSEAASGDTSKSSDSSKGGAGSVHGFDPTALERAAKAARELDTSKNASGALDLIKEQERTKQREADARRAEYLAAQEQLAIQRIRQEQETMQQTLQAQTEHDQRRAQYRDELERKRIADQINAQRTLQDEERKRQEDSVLRQEAIRRKTLEYEAELRQQTELARVKAETEGKTKQERENFDLYLNKSRLEAELLRDTVLQSIKLAGETIGTGVQAFLSDPDRMFNAAVTVTGVALGIYTAKTATGVAGRYLEATLGKPSLVRETSRKSALQVVRRPIHSTAELVKSIFRPPPTDALKEIVLEQQLDAKLRRVAISTANTRKNKAPFRNLLLYGPPGTGKTMFAKGLARHSGLDFAIMTGGDVAPLGKESVTEIHKLFDWANTTRRGLLLFVDEADAFLRKRTTEHMSEEMRNALNAFLYRTGEPSGKFMVMFASNQPNQFDYAINDRIDEFIEFELPGEAERRKILAQYLEKYILNPPAGAKHITVDSEINEQVISDIARRLEGFSGREISKLAISWQASAYGTQDAVLSKELMEQVLQDHLRQKQRKTAWNDQMAWHTNTDKLVKDS